MYIKYIGELPGNVYVKHKDIYVKDIKSFPSLFPPHPNFH